ncbi:MAG: TetR/AcrR family transcriptional regulator [Thiomonas sp.]
MHNAADMPMAHTELDAALQTLDEHKRAWVQTSVRERLALLARIKECLMPVAQAWAEAAARKKGLAADSPLAGEEWISGPYAVMAYCNAMMPTLSSVEGRRHLEGLPLRELPNGQLAAQVMPDSVWDRLLLSGVRAQVWMEPGVTRANLAQHTATAYNTGAMPEGKVALVLGAGNIAAIAPLDCLHKLFVENQVAILKMNPINADLSEFLEPAPEMTSETAPRRQPGRSRSGWQSGKPPDKKLELARHALASLAELGFARINLREIATRSGVSLGVIHDYFEDQNELLIDCVGLYKEAFIRALEERIDVAESASALLSEFVDVLVRAAQDQARTHRLWYDVRAQALFDASFRPAVDDLENRMVGVVQRLLDRVRTLGGELAPNSPIDATSAYVTIDGWFRYFLQQHIAGDVRACASLRQRLAQVLCLAEAHRA